ncbi:MAG: hypothetical protein AAFW81_11015 [Pseudomonadota bacterium]
MGAASKLTGRKAIIAAASLLALAACGDIGAPSEPPAPPPEAVGVFASDELADLASGPNDIAFWIHPNVAFASTMITAGANGIAAYNIEDLSEVARDSSDAYANIEVSYFGFGPEAAGVVAALTEAGDRVRFFGVENATRQLIALEGGPELAVNARTICLGRAVGDAAPTLVTMGGGELAIYSLDFDMSAPSPAIAVAEGPRLSVSANASACAIGADGAIFIAEATSPDIYKLDAANDISAPFATTRRAGGDALAALPGETGASLVAALDTDENVVSILDAGDGSLLGAVTIAGTADIDGVAIASAMGATAANLGSLYRDGAVALAVEGQDGEASAVRLIPFSGVLNALAAEGFAPANPRGERPALTIDDGLIIAPPALGVSPDPAPNESGE